jgi:hypothetical protein
MGCQRGLKKIASNRDVWKLILEEVKVLGEPQSQWRRRRRTLFSEQSNNSVVVSGFHRAL